MAEEQDDPYESTTRWLQEAARRTRADPAAGSPGAGSMSLLPAKRFGQTLIFGVAREIYMLGALAAAYLNYYFMQVMLEIDSLPTLVVFYPVIQPLVGG